MTVALAVAPIFMLVVLGYLLRRIGLPGDEMWMQAVGLGYWVLLPSLLFYKISTATINFALMAPFGLTLAGAFYLTGAVVLFISWLRSVPAGPRGSALQGAVRHNSFMALAVAERLYGSEGLSIAALASAVLALVTNLSIVPALLALQPASVGSTVLRRVIVDLLRNPLVLSILAGLAVNALVPGRIPVLHDVTAMLGAVALPLMLLCVGAGLKLRGLRTQTAPLVIALLGRFVIFPILVLLFAQGLDNRAVLILLIFAAVPTAPSSSALAAQTGGDLPAMNAIVTVQTGLAFVTLPATLALGTWVLG